jgi:hypothetical protein
MDRGNYCAEEFGVLQVALFFIDYQDGVIAQVWDPASG